jgi:hypothetical protein
MFRFTRLDRWILAILAIVVVVGLVVAQFLPGVRE